MRRKGFTLIELLAVIVILAIIALISTPIILNIVEKSKKGSFEDSAYGTIDAVKLFYANKSLDEKVNGETFTFPEDTKLKIAGEKPKMGNASLDEEGKVAIAISNGKWCAIKNKEEEKVRIIDYSIEDCVIEEEGMSTPESCFTVSDNGEGITGYTCTDTDIKIPEKINGITITSIENRAFSEKQLTNVEIPNSVTSIGEYAFLKNQLTSITIGNSVKSIGYGAFCENQLTSIEIPNSIASIGAYAFKSNQLTSIEIPEDVTSIGREAFMYNQLQSVEIPNSVTIIESSAFNSNQLINVVIGNSVTIIDDAAFASNQLTSAVIGNSVTLIGKSAFASNKLTSIEIPESVTIIRPAAFYQNQSNMKVTVNKSKDSIEGSPWGASSVEWIG